MSVHNCDSHVLTNSQEKNVTGLNASSASRRKAAEVEQNVPKVMLAMKGDVQGAMKCLPTWEKQAELPTLG